MDKSTLASLKAETKRLGAFFKQPPPDRMAPYGLDASPLTVLFGPDVESFPTSDGDNILRQDAALDPVKFHSTPHYLVTEIGKQFAGTRLLWKDDPCSLDNCALETRLRPSPPSAICRNFEKAGSLIRKAASAHNADIYTGDGHWHFSLKQNRQHIKNEAINHIVTDSILTFQTRFPALFLKPRIAEKSNDRNYAGPEYFGYSYFNPATSMIINQKYDTLEVRVATHAPYQPVYLILLAIRQAFIDPPPVRHTLADRENFLRGPGGYVGLLNRTLDNIRTDTLMPRPLALALLRESIRDYRAHLAHPYNQPSYSAALTGDILTELDILETLCAGSPQGPKTNGHIPAPAYSNP